MSAVHRFVQSHDYSELFLDAIQAAGLTPPDCIEDDGKLHRFSSNGKPGDTAGWYVPHSDGIPAGSFGCWRQDVSEVWKADIGRAWSIEEQTAHTARIVTLQAARDAEQVKARAAAAIRAGGLWDSASPASGDHPYLIRKGVQAYGVRLYKVSLVGPLCDTAGTVHSLQFIKPDGEKIYLTGGRKQGCMYLIGDPTGASMWSAGRA